MVQVTPASGPSPARALAPPAPAAAPSVDGLKLRGVLGGAAILERVDGRQMLARVGRSVAPGVTLSAVARDRVLLDAGGQTLRLGFGDGGAKTVASATPATTQAPTRTAPSGAVVAGLADAAREADRAYVLGLRPVEVNGRTTGFRVVPGARMPGLAEAGLEPGDVITMVNGMDFTDEERVAELGDEIAGSYEATFEFIRNGQRMTRTVAVNPRPAAPAR